MEPQEPRYVCMTIMSYYIKQELVTIYFQCLIKLVVENRIHS